MRCRGERPSASARDLLPRLLPPADLLVARVVMVVAGQRDHEPPLRLDHLLLEVAEVRVRRVRALRPMPPAWLPGNEDHTVARRQQVLCDRPEVVELRLV